MIDRHHALPITRQAELLDISRGTVYYLPKPVSEAELVLMRRLDELHLQRAAATATSLTLVPISVGTPATAPAIQLHSPGGWRIELATGKPAWLADLLRQLP